MTRRRAKDKKPSGVNRSLGSCIWNEREKLRKKHGREEELYDAENVAEMNKNVGHNIECSVTDESGLEEFLAKAQLAGRNFAAERGEFRMVHLENSKSLVTTTINGSESLGELYRKYGDRLRIPRRPPKHTWETVDDLKRLENEYFLEWRKGLADLQESDGVLLTPFERNPELWRQLWRVVERSDIVVQILDGRNPLLFRNLDLETYVKECDVAKQNIYMINKVDLLSKEQIEAWRNWFLENNIDAVFWSALEPEASSASEKEEENVTRHDDSEPFKGPDVEEAVEQYAGKSFGSTIGDSRNIEFRSSSEAKLTQNPDAIDEKIPILNCAREIIAFFKSRAHFRPDDTGGRPLVVGMVGYPNVGKSSTINKILNQKKVSVSATPGKTRHFQTLVVDNELTLCDCPGLVMPSLTLSRSEMVLNGILSIDHMREYLSPVKLLLTRVPRRYLEEIYSVMLTGISDNGDDETQLSACDLLTAIAFIRGYMSSSGVADCSRAARLILKDVVSGKVKWVAAPPNVDQKEFDKLTYDVLDKRNSMEAKPNTGIVQQLAKRRLLQDMKTSDKMLDEQFFLGSSSQVHVRAMRSAPKLASIENDEVRPSKKHFNKGKREKLRRIFVD